MNIGKHARKTACSFIYSQDTAIANKHSTMEDPLHVFSCRLKCFFVADDKSLADGVIEFKNYNSSSRGQGTS